MGCFLVRVGSYTRGVTLDPFAHFSHPSLERLPLAARVVWAFVLTYGEREYPVRDLGATLGMTYVTAQRSLEALERAGLVVCVARGEGRSASSWRAVLPS
jgi:DNA-binding transcriptional ArsR family regulator